MTIISQKWLENAALTIDSSHEMPEEIVVCGVWEIVITNFDQQFQFLVLPSTPDVETLIIFGGVDVGPCTFFASSSCV